MNACPPALSSPTPPPQMRSCSRKPDPPLLPLADAYGSRNSRETVCCLSVCARAGALPQNNYARASEGVSSASANAGASVPGCFWSLRSRTRAYTARQCIRQSRNAPIYARNAPALPTAAASLGSPVVGQLCAHAQRKGVGNGVEPSRRQCQAREHTANTCL